MNKRGFFFITDALLSLTVLTVGFMIIWTSFSAAPEQQQSVLLSEDVIKLLSSKQVNEMESNEIYRMWCDECKNPRHIISKKDNTLIQQIAEFASLGQNTSAQELINEILKEGIINPQNNFELLADDNVLYSKPGNTNPDDADLLVANKKLVMGLTSNNILVNVIIEVRTWQ